MVTGAYLSTDIVVWDKGFYKTSTNRADGWVAWNPNTDWRNRKTAPTAWPTATYYDSTNKVWLDWPPGKWW